MLYVILLIVIHLGFLFYCYSESTSVWLETNLGGP